MKTNRKSLRSVFSPGCFLASFAFAAIASPAATFTSNTLISTTNWLVLQTMTGDGTLLSCCIPMTIGTQQFYRVSQP